MSIKGNKETKVFVPKIEDSPVDISISKDEEIVTSGSPCICEGKRNLLCLLHGG